MTISQPHYSLVIRPTINQHSLGDCCAQFHTLFHCCKSCISDILSKVKYRPFATYAQSKALEYRLYFLRMIDQGCVISPGAILGIAVPFEWWRNLSHFSPDSIGFTQMLPVDKSESEVGVIVKRTLWMVLMCIIPCCKLLTRLVGF